MSRSAHTSLSPKGLAALCLCAASAAAMAQGSTSTSWSLDLRTEDLNQVKVIDDFSLSGIGTNVYAQDVVVEDTIAPALVVASNFPSVATASGPQLKSNTHFTMSNVYAGVGIRGIGISTAGLADTYTVEAAPGYTGGFLRFHWGVDGVMTANLYSGPDNHLRFVNWEFHQQAELSASASGLGTRTLSKHTMSFTSSPLTPAAESFDDFIEWNPLSGPLLLSDEPELNHQEDIGGGGPIAIDVALVPGTPFTVDFQLRTAISMGLFNVDNGELLAGHGVDFSQTASLQGVQLIDADGSPYAGAWSLDTASGINYTLLPVPEPGTWALWLAGLGGVVGVSARRRRRATQP